MLVPQNFKAEHPAGVGTYECWLEHAPRVRCRAPGHTARDAYDKGGARALLGAMSFNEVRFKLVSDKPIDQAFMLPEEQRA